MGGSEETKYDHPTQKPVDLMRRPILNLWLANNLSAGNDLTFRAGETKNRGPCRSSSFPCFVSCDSC
jgi:hypothetical protein